MNRKEPEKNLTASQQEFQPERQADELRHVPNENERANSNISPEEKGTTDQPGSEITDGEAG